MIVKSADQANQLVDFPNLIAQALRLSLALLAAFTASEISN